MSAKLKNKMLEACPDNRRGELEKLFRQWPFDEMSPAFARQENCAGITYPDGSIYILDAGTPGDILHIYLHEIAHALLFANGRDGSHDENFVRIARALQSRFEVAGHAWHDYDTQDARWQIDRVAASRMGAAAAAAIDYDPHLHAAEVAQQAFGFEKREVMTGFAILLIALAALVALAFVPWADLWSALDTDFAKLAGGVLIIVYLLFLFKPAD